MIRRLFGHARAGHHADRGADAEQRVDEVAQAAVKVLRGRYDLARDRSSRITADPRLGVWTRTKAYGREWLGYGSLDAPFWFIGLGLDQSPAETRGQCSALLLRWLAGDEHILH